jgi:hypothetical protein
MARAWGHRCQEPTAITNPNPSRRYQIMRAQLKIQA